MDSKYTPSTKLRDSLRSSFPCPAIHTNTNFLSGQGDGFSSDMIRKKAYANAREAGVNPTGKVYSSQLARKGMGAGKDPEAWIPADDPKGHIARVCQKRGMGCEGSVNVDAPAYEISDDKPYRVADDIIEKEAAMIVEDRGGDLTAQEHTNLKDEVRERLTPADGVCA